MSEEEDYNGALANYNTAGVVRDPQKQRDAMLIAYNTFLGNPNNNAIQQTDISEQQ
ncbi:hypothetical protein [Rickettsia japonica]|uniref:hypothetical protein n=1 Tax=Rickettsia japonica TaxID=35790 RepID=UPI000309CE73|nr:hypothetical protein [Rickettsia japonica]